MREEIITYISLIVAGIVGFFAYKRRVGGANRRHRFIENAKRTGCYTVGECVDSKLQFGNPDSSSLHMRSNSLKVKYKYQVDGISYYKSMTFQDPGKVCIDFPISVTVYYDRNNPKKAICPEEATKAQQLRSSCLGSMGLAILALIVTFYLLRSVLG